MRYWALALFLAATIAGVAAAKVSITARATIIVSNASQSSPFNGTACTQTPPSFTSQINAVNYDCGGQHVGFQHTYLPNSCTAGQSYRPDFTNFNAINDSGALFDIGCVVTVGDYYKQTTNAAASGNYIYNMRVGEANSGAVWNLYLDGAPAPLTSLAVQPTGGYQVFNTQSTSPFAISAGKHVTRVQCATLDTAGACGDLVFLQGAPSGAGCVNTSTNLCFLYGGYLGGAATSPWVNGINRFLDFTDNFINQNMCALTAPYPFDQGYDNPGINGDYHNAINGSAPCANKMYVARTQNEWWLNCNILNPWYNGSNCPPDETQPPVVSAATFISRTCQMYADIRAAIPNVKIDFYAPTTVIEQAYDPSNSCSFDFYEIHIYMDHDFFPSATAQWSSSDKCGVAPPSVNCAPTSKLGMVTSWAASHNRPIVVDEWCSQGFNDTLSPDGTDLGTWLVIHWLKANNVVAAQYWHDFNGASNCDPNVQPNVRQALINGFANTHYAGSTFNLIPLPTPNPFFP